MTDVHCHLIDSKYGEITPEQIIQKSQEAGVDIICNGCGLAESEKSIELANSNTGVWVCVGMAYESQNRKMAEIKKRLEQMCRNPKVVGIGEAGLDFWEGMSEEFKKRQEELLRMHLEIARELNLPVELHNRSADEDILRLVDEYKVHGVMHCFSGTHEYMKECIKRGFYIGIGGLVTFKSRGDLREVVKEIPEDRLLLETDAPYLAPEPIRGSVNIPINVKITAERVANIRNTSFNQIEEITDKNAKRLFNL